MLNITLAKFISSRKNISELSKNFKDDKDVSLVWLNQLVSLISKNEIALLNEASSIILPNQKGIFKRTDELYIDDGTIDESLKVIYSTIGKFKKGITDWREELLEKKIYLELPKNKTRSIEDISILIVENIKELLKADNISNDLQDLFSSLLNWLADEKNKYLRAKYFKGIRTDTLLYKTANESKLTQFTEILRKDRAGEITVEELANLDPRKVALLNDPDLELKIRLGEQAMAEMQKENEQFEFKKKTGDIFESLFQRIINSDSRFEIEKVEGEEDFIITRKEDSKKFYVELKSIKHEEEEIQMTHKQAKKAYHYPSTYYLCIVPNDGSVIDEPYFKSNALFDSNIGSKLTDKVSKALSFESSENGISVEFEDALLRQYKKYRYKFLIGKPVWGKDSFELFKGRLVN